MKKSIFITIPLLIFSCLLITWSGCDNQNSQNQANSVISDFYSHSGKIAFVSHQGESSNIYSMDPDGSNLVQLTSTGNNSSPVWSPDAKKIAFSVISGDQSDIYVMNNDGTGQIRLTDSPDWDSNSAWSPDGQKILFVSSRSVKNVNSKSCEIYEMNANGTGQTRLTDYGGYCGFPHWFPNGLRIIFTFANGHENPGIYSMKPDGTDRVAILSDKEQTNEYASFSPDGKKIVFRSIRPGIPPVPLFDGIYVMNADGSNQTRLDPTGLRDSWPVWSPDGKRIVFSSDEVSTHDNTISRQIWVMNADGSNKVRLTTLPGYNEVPVWSR
jgi:Tol biopolymer transport system component